MKEIGLQPDFSNGVPLDKTAIGIPELRSIRAQRCVALPGQHHRYQPPAATELNVFPSLHFVENLRELGSRRGN